MILYHPASRTNQAPNVVVKLQQVSVKTPHLICRDGIDLLPAAGRQIDL
jgi:hypothetical protein